MGRHAGVARALRAVVRARLQDRDDPALRHGCRQCHGYVGQGGITGPRLAPNPMPLEAMSVFVRNTRGAMPPYQKAILSDADLADIHAYLSSLPKGPDAKSIPLLNP
ncbi:MAG TPA: cytochrome c [Burkholderiales bacterium]|nr:cytochrome c [Burkholderiales bacterium]